MSEDSQLLREHVTGGSDAAFAAIFSRHSGMVHGVALRMVRDRQLAEEITQAVFIILARKAPHLGPRTVLAGWLYRTARLVSLEALRSERRRHARHQHAAAMNMNTTTNASDDNTLWDQVGPLLDDALNRLGAGDRNILVLRFIQQRTFAEVAETLGTSEAAAKMRATRALEKLRATFARAGVAATSAALMTALTANAAAAAPAAVKTGAASSGHSAGVLALGALRQMTVAKLKLCFACAASLLVVGVIGTAALKTRDVTLSARGFEPMAGQWEGTFISYSGARTNFAQQGVTLLVSVSETGRLCEIEMRLPAAPPPHDQLHFSHRLNDRRDQIRTIDDPLIARLDNEGPVTEAFDNPTAGEWRAAFRSENVTKNGSTECRWVVKKEEMTITRQDESITQGFTNRLYSELKLRRRGTAESGK